MPKKAVTMIRCRECGFPRLAGFFIKWDDNGTMVQLMRRNSRVVVMHHGFLDNLFLSIEAKLGISIEHIAFEAQRNASKAVIEGFTDSIPGVKYGTRLRFARRIGVELFNKVSLLTGMARTETIEYVPGKYGVARIKNPFNMGLTAANVVGVFEVLERVPFGCTWEEESKDSYTIRIEAMGEKPRIAERMKVEHSAMLPGNLHLDRCPRCKVPRNIANSFKWIDSKSAIVDTRTGARVVFIDACMVTTVLREMASELGDEIYEPVIAAQRDWTKEQVTELGLSGGNGPLSSTELRAAYKDYLEMLPLYGYGNPISLNISNKAVRIVVENPYEPSILAGTFQGLFEALEKKKCSVSCKKPRQGAAFFKIEPVD